MVLDGDFALSADERDELRRLEAARTSHAGSGRVRRAIVTTSPTSLRIAMRVHLLTRDAEAALSSRLTFLESKCMLLRHSAAGYDADGAATVLERDRVAAELDGGAANLCAVFSRIPVRLAPGADPIGVDAVDRASATLDSIRADALAVLDAALAAEVFTNDTPLRDERGLPRVRVADARAETRDRAETIVDELRRLAAVNEQLVQRMRLEIHRAARRDDGTLLGDEERQKLVARAVLDTVAAVNAAIADIT